MVFGEVARCEKTFLDVKVFNPYAASNRSSTPTAIYRSHENMKKRSYQARIHEVEHGTFTPWFSLQQVGCLMKPICLLQTSGFSFVR